MKVLIHRDGRRYTTADVARMPLADAREARASLARWLRSRPLAERKGWGTVLLALDTRCGDRPSVALSDRQPPEHNDPPKRANQSKPLAERLEDAREALYKERSGAEARERAREVRAAMTGEGRR